MKRALTLVTGGLIAIAGLTALTAGAATLTPLLTNPTLPNLTVPWTQAGDAGDAGCTSSCTSAPPSGLAGGSMAYDPATHQALLFGHDAGNATWSWTGHSWTQLDDASDPGCTTACAGSPLARSTTGMTYDAASGAVVIFGGLGLNDTWTWDGTSWTQVADASDPGCTTTCTNSPPATAGAQMAYDPATHDVVLFGGSDYTDNFDDTWVLRFDAGTYAWSQVDDRGDPGCTFTCTSSPPTRNVATLTWDPATSQLVLFGGELTGERANGLSDTWLWNGTSWSQVDDHHGALAGCGTSLPTTDTCPSSPDGRVGTAVAYDPTIGRLVLFGGMNNYGNPEYDDTWVWNGRAWLQVDDASDAKCTTTCWARPRRGTRSPSWTTWPRDSS